MGCDNLLEDQVGVERHIADRHEGKRWTFCDKIFSYVQQLTIHIDEYIHFSVECFSCRRCEKDFSQVVSQKSVKSKNC